MAKAIPSSIRSEIVRLCQSSKTVAEVSRIICLGYPGVYKIWRQYQKHGDRTLEVGYARCGRGAVYGQATRAAIDEALLTNGQLGAPIIRSRLLAEGGFDRIPHERTIQRWWKAEGKSKARGRRPKSDRSYAKQVHATWQIDGKENVTLADGTQVCYLSFTDERTCSFLRGHVFPLCPFDEAGKP